jgi:hypothetical protein
LRNPIKRFISAYYWRKYLVYYKKIQKHCFPGKKDYKFLLLYDPKLDNKKEIGYITIELKRPQIGLMWLNEPWRGYGLGKQMLDVAMDEIKKNNKDFSKKVHIFSSKNHPFFSKLKVRIWNDPHHLININKYEFLKLD